MMLTLRRTSFKTIHIWHNYDKADFDAIISELESIKANIVISSKMNKYNESNKS